MFGVRGSERVEIVISGGVWIAHLIFTLEKTKLMTNNSNGIKGNIEAEGQKLEAVNSFRYFAAIISEEGSKQEFLVRLAQSTAALTKLKTFWHDRNISLALKIRLLRTLVLSIFLYACNRRPQC